MGPLVPPFAAHLGYVLGALKLSGILCYRRGLLSRALSLEVQEPRLALRTPLHRFPAPGRDSPFPCGPRERLGGRTRVLPGLGAQPGQVYPWVPDSTCRDASGRIG